MNTTTLQIPMSYNLKTEATKVARDYGFSSLQEIVRVLLTKLSRGDLVVNIEEPMVKLSPRAIRRYEKMARDFETGRNVKRFSSIDELMRDLHS